MMSSRSRSLCIASALLLSLSGRYHTHAYSTPHPSSLFSSLLRSPLVSWNSLFFDVRESVILPPIIPPPTSSSRQTSGSETAFILIPGCQLKPQQYEDVAKKVQTAAASNNQAVWVAIPKVPFDMANPLTVPSLVQSSLKELQKQGYKSDKVFLGGHSLGGVFLPHTVGDSTTNGLKGEQVLGWINLGSFKTRDTKEDAPMNKLPSLTMTGNLDGMVRASRIAEDYHRNVVLKMKRGGVGLGNKDEERARLHHAVVLVEGMNHFGFVQGRVPFMKHLRDLPQEISQEDSVKAVAKAIAAFIDIHQDIATGGTINLADVSGSKSYLLQKIKDTSDYLEPLISALKLEGSRHVGCDISSGAPWAAFMQEELIAGYLRDRNMEKDNSVSITSSNEFHPSWYLNPFADVPFFHPKVILSDDSSSIKLETMGDPIYEKIDSLFDGGFFSNTVHELRCKFNSPQAVLEKVQAAGGQNDAAPEIPFDPPKNFAQHLNQKAIDWAMQNAPRCVRRRYERSGMKIVLGDDIAHSSGPGWIWNYLTYKYREDNQTTNAGQVYREVRSHTMATPTNHPIPSAGGKMYCKLLSPAKVLDWMYTDSLRAETNLLKELTAELEWAPEMNRQEQQQQQQQQQDSIKETA